MICRTCELLLAAISDTGLQVLQLYLDLLVVSHGLFTLPPVETSTQTGDDPGDYMTVKVCNNDECNAAASGQTGNLTNHIGT